MMATTPEASRRRRGGTSPYMPVAAHELQRQMSMPAAFAATFASCGSGGGHMSSDGDNDSDGELRGRAPRPGAGGVVRALRAWIARGSRRKAAVMSRSGSSVKEQQQYGHEEYAQNFDDGGAAAEPENLSRSFSARYARQAPWDDGGARRRGMKPALFRLNAPTPTITAPPAP
ncbi:hypothetical protein BDA96_04G096300 [Sorghum bicolor]|uniref:Uncharacterized protein n=1 Tax=Sorghum bicolor TaxID=4558 RepID=A0A921UHZ3_SORBI|nr:hypothetical protein BDA96_04G096300 [Sorghum bicolor]